MESNFILDNIKRCTKNLLIVNILLSILIGVLAFFFRAAVLNLLFGPFEADYGFLTSVVQQDFDSVLNYNPKMYNIMEESPLDDAYVTPGNRYYFKIKGEDVLDTDVIMELNVNIEDMNFSYYEGSYIDSVFYLYRMKDLYVVVKKLYSGRGKHEHHGNREISGILVPLNRSIRGDISRNTGVIKMLPFVLDATGRFKKAPRYQLLFLLLLLSLCGYNLAQVFRYTKNYKCHPIFKNLNKYGDRLEVFESINNETADANKLSREGKYLYTNRWLIRKKLLGCEIKRNHIARQG